VRSDRFRYPAGITDKAAYDAQTYLEAGTEEAMAAARRIDRRERKKEIMKKLKDLAGLGVGHQFILGWKERQAAAAEADLFLIRCAALGFTRHETAAAVLKAHELYPAFTVEQIKAYVWERMTDGTLTPVK
jgi:hypothetical protein